MDLRYRTTGHARLSGILKDDLFLKNLSITGCCLECEEPIDKITTHEIYTIEIWPEADAHIGKFELQAECIWVHRNEIGFTITISPKGKCFQNYVDYIAYHHPKV